MTTLTLYTDAKAKRDRFAICDRDGLPVWFGKFFADDRDYDGEQSSGEMAAAKKAVWLAAQVKKAVGAATLTLTLKVDAEWLTWANEGATATKGGKARALARAADQAGIHLQVDWTAGTSNPADRYTVAMGFLSYKDVDLAGLVDGAERKDAPVAIGTPVALAAPTAAEIEARRIEAMKAAYAEQARLKAGWADGSIPKPKGMLVKEAFPTEWAETEKLTSKPRSRAQSELYKRYDAEHGSVA